MLVLSAHFQARTRTSYIYRRFFDIRYLDGSSINIKISRNEKFSERH